LFDLWSLFYDAPLVQRLTYRPAHDAVLRSLRRVGVRRVLDVGCGTGQLAARLRREFGTAYVVGCDVSRGMLRQARARDAGCAWVRADAGRLPFGDACFDAVVSTEAFHWFPSQTDALAEFYRVLVPGGRALVALINPPFESLSRVTRLGSRLLGEPLYWPTQRRMREQVEAACFQVERQRRVFRIPASLAFPAILTIAVRPPRAERGRAAGRSARLG
jgi:ubiquinone/menaquinone biosynthesis C-methylase UbiE